MSKELDTSKNDNGKIFTKILPQEDNNNNTNFVVTHEQHLHSAMYKLLHTPVGNIWDKNKKPTPPTQNMFYYEDDMTYIACEDDTELGIE